LSIEEPLPSPSKVSVISAEPAGKLSFTTKLFSTSTEEIGRGGLILYSGSCFVAVRAGYLSLDCSGKGGLFGVSVGLGFLFSSLTGLLPEESLLFRLFLMIRKPPPINKDTIITTLIIRIVFFFLLINHGYL
jgi:hypothetical protein